MSHSAQFLLPQMHTWFEYRVTSTYVYVCTNTDARMCTHTYTQLSLRIEQQQLCSDRTETKERKRKTNETEKKNEVNFKNEMKVLIRLYSILNSFDLSIYRFLNSWEMDYGYNWITN